MQLVIDEIGPGAATPLQAVRLLTVYLSGGAGGKVTPVVVSSARAFQFGSN